MAPEPAGPQQSGVFRPLADIEPQHARTETGKLKMGADVESLGKILGSSLYGQNPERVIPKELLQNAMDAVRGISDGHVNVTVRESGYPKAPKLEITVSDTGTGMTKEQLETVFTDLGSSGKRDVAAASGGFGLAKAAPLMMSETLQLNTVVQTPTGKVEHAFRATPEQLLGEGVEIQTRSVPPETPTGTTVKSVLDNAEGKLRSWQATDMVQRYAKSINLPGRLHLSEHGSPLKEIGQREPLNLMAETEVPGVAKIKLYTAREVIPAISEDGIPLEINNNGIYQFDSYAHAPSGKSLRGIPKTIAVDIEPLVIEGSRDYPFSANRETMRDALKSHVDQLIKEKIIEPAVNDAVAFLSERYQSFPKFGSKVDIPFFDSGLRLEPNELRQILKDPEVIRLAEGIHSIINRAIGLLGSPESKHRLPRDIGTGVKRSGLAFSDEFHGVYVPNPDLPREGTIFINPFSFREGMTPREIGSQVWHTIKHELIHDKIKGHNEQFTVAETEVAIALSKIETQSTLQIKDLYADHPTGPSQDQIRRGLARAIQIYRESRGRESREADPFRGERSTTGDRPVGGPRERGHDAEDLRRNRAGHPSSVTFPAPPPKPFK